VITRRDLFVSLREGPYTSLGCYPKYYVTRDGSVVSHAGILENLRRYGRACSAACWSDDSSDARAYGVLTIGVNWEDSDLYCDETGERIPSAYAEPEENAS
jgi:hypothetical protein